MKLIELREALSADLWADDEIYLVLDDSKYLWIAAVDVDGDWVNALRPADGVYGVERAFRIDSMELTEVEV